MAEDIKSLTKKNADLEKRLKVAEAKIKVLADNMTDAKDIQKFMDIVGREQTDIDKRIKREAELARKEIAAHRKEMEKEQDKIVKGILKEAKDNAKAAELRIITTRLTVVESLVQAALKR